MNKLFNIPVDENFDADLFLTSEGRNLIDYVKQTYPNHFQLMELNEVVHQSLYAYLDAYFNSVRNYILHKMEGTTAKELAYNEMIETIDGTFNNDQITGESSENESDIFDLDKNPIIDSERLN